MGSEAATAPDPVLAPVAGPTALATWDDLVLTAGTSILQTSWWNEPLAGLGVASDVRADLRTGAGLLVRSARLPLVPLTVGTAIAAPVTDGWTSSMADPFTDALEDVAHVRRSLDVTVVSPGPLTGDHLAAALRRRGRTVGRSRIPARAVITLAGRTEDEVLARLSRKHRYFARRAEAGPAEIGPVTERADLDASYAALAATASRKGFDHLRPWHALRPSVEAGIERGACEVIAARREGRVVSAIVVGHTARTTEVLYAGYLDEAAPLRVNQALHVHAIRSAIARGAETYDLGQLVRADDPTDLDRFKLRFGADIVASPDAVTWSVHPRTAGAVSSLRHATWARRPLASARALVVRHREGGRRG